LGVVALIVVWFFIKALYVSAYIRHYVYDASEGFITIKKGVFTPQEIHVQWSKVQDVYVDQDLLDRMLGIYDVHLASATFSSAIEAHIDGVDKQVAGGLKMLLLDAVRRSGNTAQAPVATAAIQADTHPAFAGAVTSDQYPIDGRWVVQKFLSALGFSVVLIVLGFLVLSVAGSDMPDVIAPSTLLAVCVGGALIAFGGGFISNVIWRSNFRFELGEEYILRREGVVSRSEQHMPYRTIQDVIVSQGFFERLLGIARIDIMNAGGGLMVTSMTIPGQPVSKASELSALIRQIALSKNASQTGL
jgi:putative membrane protein